jgi:hypothetical protein
VKQIDDNLVKAVLSYLAARPWHEVDAMMHPLMTLPDVPEKEPAGEKQPDAAVVPLKGRPRRPTEQTDGS